MKSVLIALVLIGLMFSVSCKRTEEAAGDEIPIGMFLETTGDVADFGLATKAGVELAAEEINTAGGIKGKKIKLVFYDTASKPEEAGNAATKLATQDKVYAAIGSVASKLSLAAAPVFQKNGIPMVSPSSTNRTVTEQGDMIFRVCFIDDFQGAACAAFAKNDLKAKRAAVISNQDDPYSTGVASFFKSTFKRLGGDIVADESFKGGASEFNTQISNIKAKGEVDCLFVPVYYNDIALIAKQARGQGLKMPILGSDGWESPKLTKLAEGALEDCFFCNHYHPDDPNPKLQAFLKAYKTKNKETPNSLAALGYDAMYIIKQAIETAGELDRKKIADALRNTKGFDGVTGKFDIDKDRNAEKPVTMLKIKGDEFKFVRQIKPDEMK